MAGQRMQWCEGKNQWTWASMQRTKEVHCGVPYSVYLDIKKAGVHDIQFSMREDGLQMDQWLITQNKEYQPTEKKKKEDKKAYSFWNVIKEKNPNAIVIKANEFEKGNFYEDKSWLAVNPNKFKEAEASFKFTGSSDLYDVVIFGVGENDGRSRYHLSVNQFKQGNYRPPLSTDSFEEGPDYAHSFSDVQINTNDIVKLKAQIASWDGKEYSRGRWSGIAIVQTGRAEKLLQSIRQDVASNTVVKITGELKKWHKTTLTFDGPNTSEKADFNPFMNYRFNVTFKHLGTNKSYVIPGYYAADGNAGQTSADKGNKWRVQFISLQMK